MLHFDLKLKIFSHAMHCGVYDIVTLISTDPLYNNEAGAAAILEYPIKASLIA